MERLKNRFIIKVLAGALIGIAICFMLYAFGEYDHMIMDKTAFIAQFLGSAIFGMIAMGGSVVYEIDTWGITLSTVIHYSMTMGSYLVTASLLHWFDGKILLITFGLMSVGYFIIWFINYALWKREIRNINTDLKNMILEHGEDEHL